MSRINTKFNVGDKIYYYKSNNTMGSFNVESISIAINENGISIWYFAGINFINEEKAFASPKEVLEYSIQQMEASL